MHEDAKDGVQRVPQKLDNLGRVHAPQVLQHGPDVAQVLLPLEQRHEVQVVGQLGRTGHGGHAEALLGVQGELLAAQLHPVRDEAEETLRLVRVRHVPV